MAATFPHPTAVARAMPPTSPSAQPVRQCVVAENAALLSCCSACACKSLDCRQELFALLRSRLWVPGGECVGDAVIHVVVQHLEGECAEGCVDRSDLREDVDAIPISLDHSLDPANLALDPVETLDQRLLVVSVLHEASRMLWKRLSRRLLVTTNSDEAAIAAAAMMGLSKPATATGMAATLYANAQKRFPLIVRRVRRASAIASAAARRSPETNVRSLASIATSVPVPIARPRSACASAGESLTPSPTIATRWPSACSRRTSAT